MAPSRDAWPHEAGVGPSRDAWPHEAGVGPSRDAWPHEAGVGPSRDAWPHEAGVGPSRDAWPHEAGVGPSLDAWPRSAAAAAVLGSCQVPSRRDLLRSAAGSSQVPYWLHAAAVVAAAGTSTWLQGGAGTLHDQSLPAASQGEPHTGEGKVGTLGTSCDLSVAAAASSFGTWVCVCMCVCVCMRVCVR